jgi:hypothetical protein
MSYYRLKQTDIDGKTGYSDIESVNCNHSKNLILKIYPNPFSHQTTLRTNTSMKNSRLVIYNSFGRVVKQIENISGQEYTLDRENLLSGLYFISLVQDGEIIANDKLVITN